MRSIFFVVVFPISVQASTYLSEDAEAAKTKQIQNAHAICPVEIQNLEAQLEENMVFTVATAKVTEDCFVGTPPQGAQLRIKVPGGTYTEENNGLGSSQTTRIPGAKSFDKAGQKAVVFLSEPEEKDGEAVYPLHDLRDSIMNFHELKGENIIEAENQGQETKAYTLEDFRSKVKDLRN